MLSSYVIIHCSFYYNWLSYDRLHNPLHCKQSPCICRVRDSSVGIETCYGLEGRGIKSRWGRDFPHPSRPTLGPTQPPIQWVLGLSRGKVARAWRWQPTPIECWGWRKSRAIHLFPLWAFMASSRENFTFTLHLYSHFHNCLQHILVSLHLVLGLHNSCSCTYCTCLSLNTQKGLMLSPRKTRACMHLYPFYPLFFWCKDIYKERMDSGR